MRFLGAATTTHQIRITLHILLTGKIHMPTQYSTLSFELNMIKE